jgi:hypothetical protein
MDTAFSNQVVGKIDILKEMAPWRNMKMRIGYLSKPGIKS